MHATQLVHQALQLSLSSAIEVCCLLLQGRGALQCRQAKNKEGVCLQHHAMAKQCVTSKVCMPMLSFLMHACLYAVLYRSH